MGLRSTVVAPSRERICMLSWVAMERIYEREVLPDAKLRKQAGARPLRVHAKHLTDGELLAKLCSFGIEMDRTWLERECERALSAQEIAVPLMDQSESRGLESDWIWICVVTLWRRWLPDQPSFEELDDQRQAGPWSLESAGIWICVVTLWRRWFPDQPSFEELDDQRQAGYELLKTSGAVPPAASGWKRGMTCCASWTRPASSRSKSLMIGSAAPSPCATGFRTWRANCGMRGWRTGSSSAPASRCAKKGCGEFHPTTL